MSSVLDEIVGILADVLGAEFLMDTQITADTSFSDDLALESIEFVKFSERLQEHYGERVNLVALIGGMDINSIVGITVGQVVGYVEAQLAASA